MGFKVNGFKCFYSKGQLVSAEKLKQKKLFFYFYLFSFSLN